MKSKHTQKKLFPKPVPRLSLQCRKKKDELVVGKHIGFMNWWISHKAMAGDICQRLILDPVNQIASEARHTYQLQVILN